ncbi:FAD-dependent oxidoreductase, partial [candidate division KSB1 bacterium]
GVTGLNVAWRLLEKGCDVEIFEITNIIGGVGTSIKKDGYSFDFGPHILHSAYPDIIEDFKNLLGSEDYFSDKVDRQIHFKGKYYQYPLKPVNVLKGLGPFSSVKIIISFFYSFIKRKLGLTKEVSAEDWFINWFGKVGYQIYFKEYTEKAWGVHPKKLSAFFTSSRIPTISIRKLIKNQFEKLRKHTEQTDEKGTHAYGPTIHFIMYPYKGVGLLTQKIYEKIKFLGGKVRFNTKINKIYFSGNNAESIEYTFGGETHKDKIDYVISTIPLKDIIELIDLPKSEEVIENSQNLIHRAIIVIGLVVNKPKVLNTHFLYFYDKCFTRITEPKNFGLKMQDENQTVLLLEITCDIGDDVWENGDKYAHQAIKELAAEGLFSEDEVERFYIIKYPHAYPIYNIGFRERLEAIKTYLGEIPNLFSIGRQGLFVYIDMDICMKLGKILADHIEKDLPKSDQEILAKGERSFY